MVNPDLNEDVVKSAKDIEMNRQTEKLMTLSVPREIVNFMDDKILSILISEYFFRNRSIDSISKMFDIPILDLKYFYGSAEAKTILEEIKAAENEDTLKDRSIDQIKTFIIDKLETLLNTASTRDSIDAIERITPQIINLEKVIIERNNISSTKGKSIHDFPSSIEAYAEGEDYTVELATKTPAIINKEDMEELNSSD